MKTKTLNKQDLKTELEKANKEIYTLKLMIQDLCQHRNGYVTRKKYIPNDDYCEKTFKCPDCGYKSTDLEYKE
jgi:hypothetical protein